MVLLPREEDWARSLPGCVKDKPYRTFKASRNFEAIKYAIPFLRISHPQRLRGYNPSSDDPNMEN